MTTGEKLVELIKEKSPNLAKKGLQPGKMRMLKLSNEEKRKLLTQGKDLRQAAGKKAISVIGFEELSLVVLTDVAASPGTKGEKVKNEKWTRENKVIKSWGLKGVRIIVGSKEDLENENKLKKIAEVIILEVSKAEEINKGEVKTVIVAGKKFQRFHRYLTAKATLEAKERGIKPENIDAKATVQSCPFCGGKVPVVAMVTVKKVKGKRKEKVKEKVNENENEKVNENSVSGPVSDSVSGHGSGHGGHWRKVAHTTTKDGKNENPEFLPRNVRWIPGVLWRGDYRV